MSILKYVVFLCAITLASAQTQSTAMDSAKLGFYRNLFGLIGNPLDAQQLRQNRTHALAVRFGMNGSEEALLLSLANLCYAQSLQVKQTVQELLAGRAVSAPTDQATLATLNANQMQSLQGWATQLEAGLRPQIVARFETIWNTPIGHSGRN